MRRAALIALLFAAVAAPAPAKPTAASARAFLVALYRPYAQPAPSGMAPALRFPARYFEPALARAMIRDTAEAAKRDEVGALDGDPICDCQDNEPFRATIGPVTLRNGHALATARFVNFGKPVTIRYDLVATRAGWRIYDVAARDYHLRGLFKL